MDAAARGATALSANDFPSAISHYTDAISSNPQAVDYFIKRSMAYARISPADHAFSLHDADVAVVLATKRGKRELIAESQARRGIALYGLQRWADSQQCFSWAEKSNYDEKVLKIWVTKVKARLKEQGEEDGELAVKEIPEVDLPTVTKQAKSTTAASTSASLVTQGAEKKPEEALFVADKTRYDWYQSGENVVITLFAKGIPKDQVKIALRETSVQISFPTPSSSSPSSDDSHFEYNLKALYADIDPSASTHQITTTKIELKLRKAIQGQKWSSLERSSSSIPGATTTTNPNLPTSTANPSSSSSPASHPSTQSTAPVYPTSSKTGPKDWDKVVNSLSSKKKKAPPKKPTSTTSTTKTPSPPNTTPTKQDDIHLATGDERDETSNPEADAEEETGYASDASSNGAGGDEVGAFFRQIYKGASPDARRAMMKSYQESNGTALSTNWDEVGKGKVETLPPEGMEARKWG